MPYFGIAVARECDVDESIKVLENFGISIDGGLPVTIDAPLEGGLSSHDLVRMWWTMKMVVGVCRDTLNVLCVVLLSPFGLLVVD